jgi:hypothetical protein
MRFTFIVIGWPGSVHDTRVLLDTLLTYKNQFSKPPNGMKQSLICFMSNTYKVVLILQKCMQESIISWILGIQTEMDS